MTVPGPGLRLCSVSRLGPAGIGAAVALACALAFLPALRGGLVWDDAGTIPRPGPLAAAFTRSFWSPGPASAAGPDSYYRPLVNLSLGLDRLVGGQRAWYFHLVNLLLHGAAVFAFFALVRESSGAPAAVAAVAALLFGLQRLSADSVAYVSGRTDLLAGLGLLLALLGLLRYARAGGWRHGLLALAGFAVAVFSKESGAGFVVFAGGWLAGTRAVRRRWPVLAGLAAVGVAYLVARWTVLGSLVGLRPGPAGQTLALALNSTGFLLFDLCLPFNRGLFLWRPGEFGVLTSYAAPALAFLALPVLVAWSLRR
ncbi:hypothetical protein FJY71_00845, partial [candidate division WOR-3 bacterium]|nr:hypothetical protein [candidate division WOR-3 bacterium]